MTALSEYNAKVAGWTRASERKMKNQVLRLVLNVGHGYNDLKGKTIRYMGEANKISYQFPYYMVFVHKGAGRGYGGGKTGLFTRANGRKGATNPLSFGKMGTGKRLAKPWFNPVIEQQFPELADIVTNYRGEKITIKLQQILID